MNLCACIGPTGDCPCLREQRGEPELKKEIFISQQLWELLTPTEQELINNLKRAALGRYFTQSTNESTPT